MHLSHFQTHTKCRLGYWLRQARSVWYQHQGIYLLMFVRLDTAGQVGVNITGGPLQYQYRAEQVFLHWGRPGGDTGGSEHSINHQTWAGELQLYGYNTQLYSNLSQVIMLIPFFYFHLTSDPSNSKRHLSDNASLCILTYEIIIQSGL